jgi:hypothetical protein
MEAMLPTLKGSLRFEYKRTEIWLAVEFQNGEVLKVSRNSGRWRHVHGPFVDVHSIASEIFNYRDNPSIEEMQWMGNYVTNLGTLIDAAFAAIQEGSKARIKAREEMIKERKAHLTPQSSFVKKVDWEKEKTFVYLMRHKNGLTKIGRSKAPKVREKTLQAEDPRLQIIFHCEADAATENRLHKIFASVRVRGEWFDLMPHHIDWIKLILANSEQKLNRDTNESKHKEKRKWTAEANRNARTFLDLLHTGK